MEILVRIMLVRLDNPLVFAYINSGNRIEYIEKLLSTVL